MSPHARMATACGAGLLLAAAALATPAGADEATPGEVTLSVRVPEAGALGLSVAGAALDLGTAEVAEDRSGWVASGSLPTVTVTDSRSTDPGWELSAQMTPFAPAVTHPARPNAPAATAIDARLTLTPKSVSGIDVETAEPLTLLDLLDPRSTEPSTDPSDVLALVVAWAKAGSGTGSAELGGIVDFEAPLETDPGDYTAVLTLTVS